MARSRTDELLEGWKMVAHDAQRPSEAPRPRSARNSGPLGLLAAGAVAVLLIVALSLRGANQGPQPSQPAVGASPSVLASPSAAASTMPTTSPATTPGASTSADDAALAIVNQYTRDLVNGDYAAAWALLAPNGPTRAQTFAAWSAERAQFLASAGTLYTLAVSPNDVAPLSSWLAAPWSASIDVSHAVLVEVYYPALIRNNAGYSVYIVNPTAAGLQIYDVR